MMFGCVCVLCVCVFCFLLLIIYLVINLKGAVELEKAELTAAGKAVKATL